MKKNRQKARKLLASFVKVEVKLALTIMSEGWDFATYYDLVIACACNLAS